MARRHLRRALQQVVAARDRGEAWLATPGRICDHMEALAAERPDEFA